jgi:predicted RNase H-like HicB family nuclease
METEQFVLNVQRCEIQVKRTKEALPFPRTMLLGSLSDPRVRVTRPIPVEITRAEGSVVASVPEFEEFGQGDTSSEALQDLSRSLAELFLSLRQDQERLGSDLHRLLGRLQSYLAFVALK